MGQNKGKQFNLTKRDTLSRLIIGRYPESDISVILNMSPSSISREVKRNRIVTNEDIKSDIICYDCENRFSCNLRHVCGRAICRAKCVDCKSIKNCKQYKKVKCNIESRWPLCCNQCAKEKRCALKHYFYYPDEANTIAKNRQSDSRIGADLTEEEFKETDNLLHDGIVIKSQSVHHVLLANKEKFNCSEKTIYRRIEKGIYRTKNIDLPRQPGLKHRKHKTMADKYAYKHRKDIDRTGHLYSDWLIFKYKNSVTFYVQMDFLGVPMKSTKEILVFTIPEISFVFLYIVENTSEQQIKTLFDEIEKEVSIDVFTKILGILLTDRDVVFDDYTSIEFDDNGVNRTHVFFCNPGQSNQKANVENINAQLRILFPKKALLNDYTQEDLYFAASNMNSRFLNSIDNKTPYDLFSDIFGENIAELFHIKKIDPQKVTLKPIHR